MGPKNFEYWNAVPKPSNSHIIIPEELTPNRLIVVGDIHGCFEEFKQLLLAAGYDFENEQIVNNKLEQQVLVLGDLVNKGPYSAEVIKFIKEKNFLCIRGNHDDAALVHALNLIPEPHPAYENYLYKLNEQDIEWLKELPYSITIPSLSSCFVHAGVLPHQELTNQSPLHLTTIRNIINLSNHREILISEAESQKDVLTLKSNPDFDVIDLILDGTSSTKEGLPWTQVYNDYQKKKEKETGKKGLHIYYGHDAARGLTLTPYTTGLDTGCAYGRQLSCMILPERKLIQVEAFDAYEPIKLKNPDGTIQILNPKKNKETDGKKIEINN